jgi:hypothetical protein
MSDRHCNGTVTVRRSLAALAWGIVTLSLVTGCHNPARSVPRALIQYVVIDDGVSDQHVRVQAGQEVRWVNVRRAPVSVVFNGLQYEDVSCTRGFSNSTNAHLAAVILPDDNASLCFSALGRRTYRVLDAHRPGVELNHEATVEIIEAR